MGTFVRAAALTNYFEIAQQQGLDPYPLLKKLKLTGSMLDDRDLRIPAAKVITLLEESARMSGCATFGLRMAESRQLGDIGVISLLLTHQRTLRDALAAVMQYRRLLNEALAISIEDIGNISIVRQEIAASYAGPMRQATELALGVLSRLCGSLLGSRWRPYSINFTHDAPPDLHVHRRVFTGRLEFLSDFNGIVCAAADLDLPNPLADSAIAQYAQQAIEALPGPRHPSIVLDVRQTIQLMLPNGGAKIEDVAGRLGMNVRTLQRRLEGSGEVFSELVNGVRRELVLRYMETPGYSLSHIAELVGYATPSSFTRWFIAQFGTTPKLWRAQTTDA